METTIIIGIVVSVLLGVSKFVSKEKLNKKAELLSKILAALIEKTLFRIMCPKREIDFEEGVIITILEFINTFVSNLIKNLRRNNGNKNERIDN